ncbi:MAG: hypothetical protein R3F60_14655 [bacterium]
MTYLEPGRRAADPGPGARHLRDAPTEFVQRVGVLTLPSLLGLAEGATIEAPWRVFLKDAGRGAVGPRVEALLGQIGESLCGRAQVTVAELADEAARLRAPICRSWWSWEAAGGRSGPSRCRRLRGAAAREGLRRRSSRSSSATKRPRRRLRGRLRGLVSKGADEGRGARRGARGRVPEAVALPPLETIGVGDVMTWIREYGAYTVGDAASRLLLEERP